MFKLTCKTCGTSGHGMYFWTWDKAGGDKQLLCRKHASERFAAEFPDATFEDVRSGLTYDTVMPTSVTDADYYYGPTGRKATSGDGDADGAS